MMKVVWRSVLRSRVAAVLGIIVLLSLFTSAAIFHGTLYAWSIGGHDSRFLAAHRAAMRTELARIHAGKVDSSTLKRILELNAESADRDTATNASPDAVIVGRVIAQYLARHSTIDKTEITNASFVSESDADPSPAVSHGSAAEDESERTYVGQKTCEGCHHQEASNWAHTIHAAVFTLNPRDAMETHGCEACHGPGSAHIKRYACLAAERPMSLLSSGRPANLLARLDSREQQPCLQRLSQSHVEFFRPWADGSRVHQSDLLCLPQGAARRIQQALPHALAGGQNHLRRLPQPARLHDRPASQGG
jgi:hypothetical protein